MILAVHDRVEGAHKEASPKTPLNLNANCTSEDIISKAAHLASARDMYILSLTDIQILSRGGFGLIGK